MRNRYAIVFLMFWSAVFAAALLWRSDLHEAAPGSVMPDPSDVRRIVFVREGETNVLALTNGAWRVTAPIDAETDPETVNRLLDVLAFRVTGDTVTDADLAVFGRGLSEFGLRPPRVEMHVFTADAESTLLIGRDTPGGGEVYARFAGTEAVFTVTNALREVADRPVDAFRSRRVVRFLPDDVEEFSLRIPGKPFVRLVRADNGAWRIVLPTEAPADAAAVQKLLAAFAEARILGYAAQGVAAPDADSAVSVSFRVAGGEKDKVVFDEAAAGTERVRAGIRDGTVVVTLSSGLLQACLAGGEKLRDLRLFPVDAADVRSVTITESGTRVWQLERVTATNEWRLALPVAAPAEAKLAGDVLERVLALRQNDVAVEGMDGTVRVSVAGGEGTLAAIPVSASVFSAIGGLDNLRSKTVLAFDPLVVSRVKVISAGGTGTEVAFDGRRGEWTAKGARPKAEAIRRMVLALSELKAASVEKASATPDDLRRFGLARGAGGESEPTLVVSVDFTDAAAYPRRNILVGDVAPGGGRYVTTGGAEAAVFVLPQASVSLLMQPLTE